MSILIEIYTGPMCSYCDKAKELLKKKGLNYNEIKLDKNPEKRKEMLNRTNGKMTVPQIFINDIYIGGFQELNYFEISGKLNKILTS